MSQSGLVEKIIPYANTNRPGSNPDGVGVNQWGILSQGTIISDVWGACGSNQFTVPAGQGGIYRVTLFGGVYAQSGTTGQLGVYVYVRYTTGGVTYDCPCHMDLNNNNGMTCYTNIDMDVPSILVPGDKIWIGVWVSCNQSSTWYGTQHIFRVR